MDGAVETDMHMEHFNNYQQNSLIINLFIILLLRLITLNNY